MKILANDEKLHRAALAIGTFDGVHLGHAEVFKTLDIICGEEDLEPYIYTFSSLPQELLNPSISGHKRIMTVLEKLSAMEKLGVKNAILQEFSASYANISHGEFVLSLKNKGVLAIVVGNNFTYGKEARGNIYTLNEECKKNDIELKTVEPVIFENEAISSTRIRSELERGDIEKANAMLSYPYAITGKVIYGTQIGRTIGIPTINQEYDENTKLLPRNGVFFTNITILGKKYNCVTNIGVKPTVKNSSDITAETHIINFNGDLYGQVVTVEFVKFLRDERRFENKDKLLEQIKRDILEADGE